MSCSLASSPAPRCARGPCLHRHEEDRNSLLTYYVVVASVVLWTVLQCLPAVATWVGISRDMT